MCPYFVLASLYFSSCFSLLSLVSLTLLVSLLRVCLPQVCLPCICHPYHLFFLPHHLYLPSWACSPLVSSPSCHLPPPCLLPLASHLVSLLVSLPQVSLPQASLPQVSLPQACLPH